MSDKDSAAGKELNPPPAFAKQASGADAGMAAAQADTMTRTVLVVEDDPDTQAFMVALLGRHYHVVTAASESEFWLATDAHASTLCLILMDLTLRGSQDGLTLTRQFRADPRWNAVPVVALTAHATTEDRERALAAGCAFYVSKPVDRRRLLEVIRSLTTPSPP
jgi:CheY-like chemotaxis protein